MGNYLDFETKVILKHTEIKEVLGVDNFILAGGALRDIATKYLVNDYDCFFLSEDIYKRAIENLKSKNAILIKTRINSVVYELNGCIYDIILSNKKDMNDIVNSFDFHCCAAG